jgi:hypothetical protein
MQEFEPQFSLVDALEHQKQHPKTFELPDEWNRSHIKVGECAKLMFRFPANRFPEVERMWVRVTEASQNGYKGILDNNPTNIEFIRSDEAIAFEPRHVISIWPPRVYFGSLSLEDGKAGTE